MNGLINFGRRALRTVTDFTSGRSSIAKNTENIANQLIASNTRIANPPKLPSPPPRLGSPTPPPPPPLAQRISSINDNTLEAMKQAANEAGIIAGRRGLVTGVAIGIPTGALGLWGASSAWNHLTRRPDTAVTTTEVPNGSQTPVQPEETPPTPDPNRDTNGAKIKLPPNWTAKPLGSNQLTQQEKDLLAASSYENGLGFRVPKATGNSQTVKLSDLLRQAESARILTGNGQNQAAFVMEKPDAPDDYYTFQLPLNPNLEAAELTGATVTKAGGDQVLNIDPQRNFVPSYTQRQLLQQYNQLLQQGYVIK